MRTEHIECRLAQQQKLIDLITPAYENLTRIDGDRNSRSRVSTRLSALKDQWEKFDVNHDAIHRAVSKLESRRRRKIKQRSYFREDKYTTTYEAYLENVAKMTAILDDPLSTNPRPISAISNSQQSTQVSVYHGPRLPRIDLPKFNGNLAEWLPFRDLFSSLVLENPTVSAVEKLQYLKTSLTGSASHLLKNTSLTADNFQKSWDALISFYENKRLLVNSALQSLFAIKKMSRESASEIEYLYTSMMQVYRTMETLGRPIQAWDDVLVFLITQRLDSESLKAWENYLGPSKEPPAWDQIRDFLLTRMLALQAVEKSQSSHPPAATRQTIRSHVLGQRQISDDQLFSRNDSCVLCSANHYLGSCSQYLQKTPKQRRDVVIEKSCCFNCLGSHRVSRCQSTRRCLKCGKRHHSSLHLQNDNAVSQINPSIPSPDNLNSPRGPGPGQKAIHHVRSGNETLLTILATAQVTVRNVYGNTVKVRALLDQGSEISLVSETLMQLLDLPRSSTSFPLIGVGANQNCRTRGVATIEISPHFDSSKIIAFDAHILPKLTAGLPSSSARLPDWPHLKNLQLADPSFSSPGRVDLLLGADVYAQILEGPLIKGSAQMPIGQLTSLGWIISGPAIMTVGDNHRTTLQCALDHDLHALLEKFWHQEEVCPSKQQSIPQCDQECESHFLTTHSRDQAGRYIVRLPFSTSLDHLGDSRSSALRMLNHLSNRFRSSPSYLEAYAKFVQEYEALQHMIQVPENSTDPEFTFYLPHHGVIRDSSTTTKLRVVFNGSCRTTNGKPINEILHTGQKLQNDIFDVIIRFRQFKYVFSADIEKMFRQIKVHPDDWKFQRIMWKENGHIQKYELTTVTYGLACAPYLALRCVLQLTQDEGFKFPLAVDTVEKGRYVDDVFGGADTIVGAQEKAAQVFELCMAGGFPLRKWNSNQPDVLTRIPADYHTAKTSVQITEDVIQALGLLWQTRSDTFTFNVSSQPIRTVTKRSVLSKIAQLFDPIGLLSPVVISSKIFLQELWALKLGWDDPLPPEQREAWDRIVHSLQDLQDISVPRWIGIVETSRVELHGFCDASQLAMAAVIYVRVVDSGQTVQVSLVCSKTKVAPIKRVTIPRLELSGAVILTKLMAHCRRILNLQEVPCYLWTDSSIVHTWINNHPSRWKEFVHNRVCFIQEALSSARWRLVPGILNPADCATRGLTPNELKSHPMWWNGPQWLAGDPSIWPVSPPSTEKTASVLEKRPSSKGLISCAVTKVPEWDLLNRYSSFTRLLRITALCQQAIIRFKHQHDPSVGFSLNPSELDQARKFWIHQVQRRYFQQEIQLLIDKAALPTSNPIVRLTPFLDNEGLLRVGGRLQHSTLGHNTKHPYILPKDNHLAFLIIRHAHLQSLHGSTQETLAYVRNDYWILGGRNPVRSYILKCARCTRYRQQHAQELMGQLPYSRVNPSRPFLHSGVDYAGPFSLKTWKGRSSRSYKSWVALFICLATSAIHLELVTDYSAEAFIAAYKRFAGRRGICATLTSDCGTNFKGADKELRKFFNNSSKELLKVKTLIANDGTSWKFNPPAAPHFGGKWEAGVKSVKYHMRRVVGLTLLTYEEMSTVLIQIEAILNSRPLCPLTNDSDELNILTPAHFLIGQPLTLVPEPNLEHLQQSRLSRWQHLSQMIQSFWTKWSKEYLQRHQAVYKWNRSHNDLSVGTVVFIIDERYPPAKWALGRILQLHPGKDHRSRVATVKTSTATFTRPIVKLCPLNLQPEP